MSKVKMSKKGLKMSNSNDFKGVTKGLGDNQRELGRFGVINLGKVR
jgi:hypothetical protein